MKFALIKRRKSYQYFIKFIVLVYLFTSFFSLIPPTVPVVYAADGPITYRSTFSYDLNSNLISRTTPNGDIIQYAYDGLNRLDQISYSGGDTVSYTYDDNGNRLSMTDAHGITYYAYDNFNLLRAVQFPGINPVYYDYNKAGKLTKITYPTGEEVTYEYDDSNRLIQVTDNTGTAVYEYDNQTNNLIKETLPNGVTTEYTYDTAKRITDVVNEKSDLSLISSYHYDFDENGNWTQITETTPAGTKTTNYTYDKLDRLTHASCSDGTFETYTYDAMGNRLTKETLDGTINYAYDADNRLIRAGDTIFFYDASGNLIHKVSPDKTTDYSYNEENRLIEYADGTDTATFEYDGDGNRVSKTVNGIQKRFVNHVASPVTQTLIETNAQNQVISRYVYGLLRINQVNQGAISYYSYNNRGRSVTALTNDAEEVTNTYDYDSFGNVLSATETTPNTFQYVGEQFDEETGLIFLRNRYYDPELGRFITKDPFPGYVQDPQTRNPYPYVSNNPVKKVDPLGLQDEFLKYINGEKGLITGVGDTSSHSGEGFDFVVNTSTGNKVLDVIFSLPGIQPIVDQVIIANNPELRDPNIQWSGHSRGGMLAATNGLVGPKYGCPGEIGLKGSGSGHGWKEYLNGPSSNSGVVNKGDLIPLLGHSVFKKGSHNDAIIGWGWTFFFGASSEPSNLNTSSKISNFGGVSLSQTADLMLNIDDIAGAVFDDATGQVILIGRQNTSLPEMDLDDLAVAVRSVYGYGGLPPKDPGVSIGTEPSGIPGQMLVRYDGQTWQTEFGWVMFESDRILKCLSLGKDNLTGQPFSSGVPGYMSTPDRYQQRGGTDPIPTNSRMWFFPQEVILVQSDDDSSMLFDTVVMELLTESKMSGEVVSDSVTEDFAEHFTLHYDGFAADNEFPILKDLKRLGKITSVVKWIKDNNIPFDLSFFESYVPEFYSTPQYTPETSITVSWSADGKIRQLTITGGVVYRLDASNFSTIIDPVAGDTGQSAIDNRTGETDFMWGFQAQNASGQTEDFTAVAQSMSRSKKDGSIKRMEVDMSFPVEGENPLTLVRYYNSFNDKSSGFSLGWESTPSKLRFPAEKRIFTFGGQGVSVKTYYQVFVTTNGEEHLYTLTGLDTEQRPVYATEGGQHFLKGNTDDTYTLYMKNQGSLAYDSSGKLARITDNHGIYIDYIYTGQFLSSIVHQGGRTITLNYTGDRITSATGPGGKTMTYGYDANDNLITVINQENETLTYAYDDDKRLNQVIDPLLNIIFQATNDDYNRATSQTHGINSGFSQDFSLADRMSTITDPNSVVTTQYFDSDYRLLQSVDAMGRQLDMTYDNDFGPATVTDPEQNTTTYQYDAAGNLTYVMDASNGVKRFFHDNNNNLVAMRDTSGIDTAYAYDDSNRLIEIRHSVVLEFDVNENFTGNYSYDPNNVTTFIYDPANGNLLSVADPEGNVQNVTYDSNAMPEVISNTSGYQTTNTYDSFSRLTGVSNPGGESVSYTYDDADRIKTITTSAGTTTYTYDANGNVDTVCNPRNFCTDYDYDANNNLVKVTDAENGITQYEYDTANNTLTRIILANGTIKEFEYDDLNRLVEERNIINSPEPFPAVLVESLDVGDTTLGNSTLQGLSICNVGNGTLQVTNIVTDNPNFTVNTTTIDIPPGECRIIDITYANDAMGQETAILTITYADASTTTVGLFGEVVLTPLEATAASESSGIRVSWIPYNYATAFNHYDIYRSGNQIIDVSGLTPIETDYTISTDQYLDTDVIYGQTYYYCVTAEDAGSNLLTEIDSIGPIMHLNYGKIGPRIETAITAADETSVDIALNTSADEYLAVYEFDASGTGADYDIYGQRIGADGQLIGSAFVIMSSSNYETHPQVAYNSMDNEYLVVAEHDSNGAGLYQIRVQRVTASGTITGSLTNIFSSTYTQNMPCIAYNSAENHYLVVFENDYNEDGREDMARVIVNPNGSPGLWGTTSLGGDARLRKHKVAYNSIENEYYTVAELTNNTTYSDIVGTRVDNSAARVGPFNYVLGHPNKSILPDVCYNPDRNEYVAACQHDYYGDASEYILALRRVFADGSIDTSTVLISSPSDHDLLYPGLASFDSQDEFLLTFTILRTTGESNVYAHRLFGDLHDLVTYHSIGIGTEASRTEQVSCIVFNPAQLEFMVGYEYDNGSSWDVMAQRIGQIIKNISIVPTSLDFSTDLTEDNLLVEKITGEKVMSLVSTTDQSWINVAPRSIFVSSDNPSATLTVTADRSALSVGTYSGNVVIDCEGIIEQVPVSLEVPNQAPAAPFNPEPANGSVNQAALCHPLTVTINWDCTDPNFEDPLTFNVYLSANESLVAGLDPAVRIANGQVAASLDSGVLDYATTYYWLVEALDSHGASTPGSVWNFTTIHIPSPLLVEYTPDPTNNRRPTLSWDDVTDASSYYSQIDDNEDFSTPVVSENTGAASEYTPTVDLPEGTVYWRVASIDNLAQQGPFSEFDSFTLDTLPPCIPLLISYTPDPTASVRPSLSWQDVGDASNYHIQISTAVDFSGIIMDEFVSKNTFTPKTDLPEGDIHWRLSSIDDAGNESAFSSADDFIIDITAPEQITGLTVTQENRNARLNWNLLTDTDGDFNHFNIYRDTSPISNVSLLSPISQSLTDPGATTWIDTGVVIGQTYYFAVTAEDDLGNENRNVNDAGPLKIVTPGDVNGDGEVDLIDAVICFRIFTGVTIFDKIYYNADVNGDGKIGMEEVIYILESVSGVR